MLVSAVLCGFLEACSYLRSNCELPFGLAAVSRFPSGMRLDSWWVHVKVKKWDSQERVLILCPWTYRG